ncbi:MAG: hypothetical protein WBO92_05125, partial [Candidatus Moraniibacteriota bacterium]
EGELEFAHETVEVLLCGRFGHGGLTDGNLWAIECERKSRLEFSARTTVVELIDHPDEPLLLLGRESVFER